MLMLTQMPMLMPTLTLMPMRTQTLIRRMSRMSPSVMTVVH
jgi:hypothetical protein